VHTVYDGPQAVEAVTQFHPDVVLLDIGLPTLNGYETARRMRTLPDSRDALIIALTGWGQEEDRRRSREAGFDHHLVKPVDLRVLEGLLATRNAGSIH
jgi:CheY-like chemotaxis protein